MTLPRVAVRLQTRSFWRWRHLRHWRSLSALNCPAPLPFIKGPTTLVPHVQTVSDYWLSPNADGAAANVPDRAIERPRTNMGASSAGATRWGSSD
jgi:hypothetical protein